MNPFTPFSLNIRGRILMFDRPTVMAIINATPDSFYAPSRAEGVDAGVRAARAVADGAEIIDVGACSTRPGSDSVTPTEEIRRLRAALKSIRERLPEAIVSVDTYRADVARAAVEEMGADIINDIGGGLLDERMLATVGQLRVPYILSHTRGTPATMQQFTDYPNGVTAGVIRELAPRVRELHELGVADIIIDPGLGFAKTTEQNFTLLHDIPTIKAAFSLPILIGLSRKSMLTKTLSITADEALCATVAADTIALTRGASILRVHDPLPCRQSIKLLNATFNN